MGFSARPSTVHGVGAVSQEPHWAPSTCRPKIAKGGMLPILRGSRNTSDLGPGREGLGSCGSILDGSDVIAAEREEVVDLVVGREEPLRLAG